MEILRGLNWEGEDGMDCRLDVGRVFKSGVIVSRYGPMLSKVALRDLSPVALRW